MTNEMTVTLTDEQVAMLAEMLETRQGRTMESLVQSCLDFGITNKLYRTRRNKKVYAQTKMEGALLDSLAGDEKMKSFIERKKTELGY